MMRKPWIILLITSSLLNIVSKGPADRFTPDSLVFQKPDFTTNIDSQTCSLVNTVAVISEFLCKYMSSSFIDDSSGFWLAPSASKTFKVKFYPRQNIEYNSMILFHSDLGDLILPVKGYGKFKESLLRQYV